MAASSARLRPVSATLIGFCAILLWSALALLTALSGVLPPFELAALTFAIGGGLRARIRRSARPSRGAGAAVAGLARRDRRALRLPCALFRGASPGAAGDASLIAYLWPLLIVLFSAALPGESLKARHVVGPALGFAGAAAPSLSKGALSKGAGFASAEGSALVGYGLALGCAFVWSGHSVLSRSLSHAHTRPSPASASQQRRWQAALCHAAFETTVVPANA